MSRPGIIEDGPKKFWSSGVRLVTAWPPGLPRPLGAERGQLVWLLRNPQKKAGRLLRSWYNNVAFQTEAQKKKAGIPVATLNGDAFSDEMKQETIQAIKDTLPGGKVDQVIYSLASPAGRIPNRARPTRPP